MPRGRLTTLQKRSAMAGFFFALGHSTVVLLMSPGGWLGRLGWLGPWHVSTVFCNENKGISMRWHINGISITMEYQWYIYIYYIYIYIYMMFGWITVSLALVMVLLFFSCKILDTYHINGVYLHLFTSYFDVKSMAQGFDPSSFFFGDQSIRFQPWKRLCDARV